MRDSCIVYAVPVHIVDHPLVHDALTTLRDKATPPELFRRMAVRISLLLAAEATRDVPSATSPVETPLGPAPGRRVSGGVVVVPVLRAGPRHAGRRPRADSVRAGGPHRAPARRADGRGLAVLFEAAGGSHRLLRSDDRPHARDRGKRGRGAGPAAAGGRPRRADDLHRRRRPKASRSSSAIIPMLPSTRQQSTRD